MQPFYQNKWVTQYRNDALSVLSELEDESVDLVVTDPPYGLNFMSKAWDKALPDKKIWQECLRVLKPGAFAFVMSIPRADCLSRMIISLEDAGFLVNFTPIYWAYASGFPKASNVSKMVDKRLGTYIKGEISPNSRNSGASPSGCYGEGVQHKTIDFPQSPQAKALDGSYGGFQPKPAVEIVIVAMKPLSEKTFVDQALKNRKGITWLDDGRIPYLPENDMDKRTGKGISYNPDRSTYGGNSYFDSKSRSMIGGNNQGRFPANLCCSDDCLNDGKVTIGQVGMIKTKGKHRFMTDEMGQQFHQGNIDSGSFSRYFDLDKWWAERIKQLPASVQKTFPFLIVPKASKREKNKGCEDLPEVSHATDYGKMPKKRCKVCGCMTAYQNKPGYELTCGHNDFEWVEPKEEGKHKGILKNIHPTVKPIRLLSYLITLGSRAGDVVLDPFMGSGTTPLACQLLNRKCIGIEIEEKYCEIASRRCSQEVMELGYD